MKEKHFIINLAENLVVTGTIGTINRNSNSSQWLDVALEKWKLNEDEALFITLEHYDEDTELTTKIGPLLLTFNTALNHYVTLAPPEFVKIAGQWSYSIELRYDIEDDNRGKTTTIVTTVSDRGGNVISTTVSGTDSKGDMVYNSITSAVYFITVIDSIVSATGTDGFVKETELVSAAKIIANNSDTALIAAREAAESAVEAGNQADRATQNAEAAHTAAEEAKAAATLATSKATVIWGFNEAVDITDLDWEVK
ncbi:MAG: hypothetical protein K2L12_05485 [Clostridia bacterium]|nr:hypothetical protein [Clostridia bacterium]